MNRSKRIARGLLLFFLLVVAVAGGWAGAQAWKIFHHSGAAGTPQGSASFGGTLHDIIDLVHDPYAGFP